MSVKVEVATPQVNIKDEEIMHWLRRDSKLDQSTVSLLKKKAFADIESMTNTMFEEREVVQYTNEIETDANYPYIELMMRPVTEVTDVYAMNDDVYTTISGSYVVEINDGYSRVYITDGVSYDGTAAFPFKVEYNAGMEMPDDVKVGVFQLTTRLFFNRGDVGPEDERAVPIELDSVIDKYRTTMVI